MSGDEGSLVERVAREMLLRDGAAAAQLARERAALEERLGDRRSAAIWLYIADEIERLQSLAPARP